MQFCNSIIESGDFLRRYYLKNLECVEVTEVDFVTFFVLSPAWVKARWHKSTISFVEGIISRDKGCGG